ncbi:MAG: right-handed parallel beta-helix repeat-containing protein [Candidatus Sumerlaeota bacterium]|nr:right-handed parallel beta-helix repeat-containing protein [Candidatus Sumerlaeota bacterium]
MLRPLVNLYYLRHLTTYVWLFTGVAIASAQSGGAGKEFDLQGFIDKEIKAGSKKIVVPPGQYRVKPKKQQHLALRDLQDIQIIADGVEMICTETNRALTIANCRNVTLRGLTIDYDPLPFTQGRIVKFSDDKKIHEIEIFEGYPEAKTITNFKYEIFRPDTRTLRCEDHGIKQIEVIDPRHVRLVCQNGNAKDREQVGDIIVIGSSFTPGGGSTHAIECNGNVNVRLESITLYASNCFGFLEFNCDGSVYYRCKIDRRPALGDLVKRADPRIRSLNADAYHSKHAIKGPSYIECAARFMGDDCINICGDYHMITECRGAELRVLAKGAMNIAAGDPVELMTYEGVRLSDAKAVKIEPNGKINDAEKAFLLKQRMDEGIRTRWNASAYKVTLDRAIDVTTGALIASTKRMGNGFLVQGCDFGYNRSRGILIKASDGKVIGNKLTENWMSGVLVTPEYWWLESGSSNNVEIRDNVITGCHAPGIQIFAHGGRGKIAPAGAHNHISVINNTLTDCPLPNIYVTSTDDLRIERNTCAPLKPTNPSPAAKPAPQSDPIKTENCSNVKMADNAIK